MIRWGSVLTIQGLFVRKSMAQVQREVSSPMSCDYETVVRASFESLQICQSVLSDLSWRVAAA